MDDGSPRIAAARWVLGLGRLYWALLVLAAAWSLLAVLFTWSLVALAVPLLIAGYATAWGALVRAFAAHRRGAWQLLVGLTAIDLLWPVAGWLAGRPLSVLTVASLAVHAALLGLLLHRDSREWVGADAPRRPRVEDPGGRPGVRR
jgi:hypothetical protein